MKSMQVTKLILISLMLFSCSQTSKNTNLSKEQESEKLNQFFQESFDKNLSRFPTWQTYLGRKTNYEKLDNNTSEFIEESYEINKKESEALAEFNSNNLTEEALLSYNIFKYQLDQDLESYKWRYHSFPLNQMFGFQSTTPSFLINMHQINTLEHAKAYITRLKEIKRVFEEKISWMKQQEQKGIYPPKFVFEKARNDSQNILTGRPFTRSDFDSTLLADFNKKINKLKIQKDQRNSLMAEAKTALFDFVRPAYENLLTYIEHLDSKVTESQGAWSLPDGEQYYAYRLRNITTTDLSADKIHEIGLSEVKRIHSEMEKIKDNVGFMGSLKKFFHYMKNEKEFLFPDTKAGKEAYLKQARSIVAKMEQSLPKMFKTLPKSKLKIKAVEEFREKTAGIAFYQGPAMEGDRPGIYYVNLYKMADNPKYKMEALAYHEAVPGHHMQISIATELKNLPYFRRTAGFTAYSEGWGLYSELLPKEYGFYKDPYSDFGRLNMELWRACRLVVDTGIHAKKWSREKAIEYLKENTPNAELEIVKGVERYFIMPGQAVAYKVGMLKILELREMAKAKLGDKFDIRSFHDVVLKNGAVPLMILEEQVNSWIKEKLKT
jgi:uncharacterized protein (DUF885 family)